MLDFFQWALAPQGLQCGLRNFRLLQNPWIVHVRVQSPQFVHRPLLKKPCCFKGRKWELCLLRGRFVHLVARHNEGRPCCGDEECPQAAACIKPPAGEQHGRQEDQSIGSQEHCEGQSQSQHDQAGRGCSPALHAQPYLEQQGGRCDGEQTVWVQRAHEIHHVGCQRDGEQSKHQCLVQSLCPAPSEDTGQHGGTQYQCRCYWNLDAPRPSVQQLYKVVPDHRFAGSEGIRVLHFLQDGDAVFAQHSWPESHQPYGIGTGQQCP